MAIPRDELWPRAGDWPALDSYDGDIDLALIGVPAWRTSLSPTGAHATPAAVRTQRTVRFATLCVPELIAGSGTRA